MQTVAAKANQLSLFVVQEAVSKSALLLFRDIVGLSKRTGYGFINTIHSLVKLLGRDISERRLWQLIAELKAAGWISWESIRRRGERGIKFAPLVRLPKQTRGRFAPRAGRVSEPALPVVQGPFSCPEVAPSIALSNAKSCTLDRGTPLKTSPVGTKDDNRTSAKNEALTESPEAAVAVSLLENVVSSHEAQELARESVKLGLSKEQIERVLASYKAQITNIHNRGAWLRRALQRGYNPPSAPATHSSEINPIENAKRITRADLRPEEIRPTVQPGADLLAASRIPALSRILSKRKSEAK